VYHKFFQNQTNLPLHCTTFLSSYLVLLLCLSEKEGTGIIKAFVHNLNCKGYPGTFVATKTFATATVFPRRLYNLECTAGTEKANNKELLHQLFWAGQCLHIFIFTPEVLHSSLRTQAKATSPQRPLLNPCDYQFKGPIWHRTVHLSRHFDFQLAAFCTVGVTRSTVVC